MATANQEDAGLLAPTTAQPRLRWTQIVAISIFAFAFNFHWGALGLIIVPSQVLKIAGDLNKGTALAFVLVPGAFVALFSNPLFGWLSDRTGGRLAAWGRRRPYIFLGTLVNVAALVWMASARDIPTLTLAYALTQFSSNCAQAPFHALLPDIVPAEQRGLASGTMGLLLIAGQIGGVIIAGLFINTSQPPAAYQQGLWITYGVIIAVMLVLMLVTISTVHDRAQTAPQAIMPGKEQREERATAQVDEWESEFHRHRVQGKVALGKQGDELRIGQIWIARATLVTIGGTLVIILLAWGLMALWNTWHIAGLVISGDVQQVVLEVLATVGILRLFDFNPRRDPDFAWVVGTRLVMMLGIYTIQTFLLYFMRDSIGVTNPAQATTSFVILVSLTSLITAFAAGWLSDHFGRKRMVYLSGTLMALVGLIFVLTHSLAVVIAAGAIFGLGYGAYQSVDWALVVDVLPSNKNFARDMGVWNIAISLAQVIAPVLGGPILDAFTKAGHPIQGFQVLFTIAILYCIIGTIAVRFVRAVKF